MTEPLEVSRPRWLALIAAVLTIGAVVLWRLLTGAPAGTPGPVGPAGSVGPAGARVVLTAPAPHVTVVPPTVIVEVPRPSSAPGPTTTATSTATTTATATRPGPTVTSTRTCLLVICPAPAAAQAEPTRRDTPEVCRALSSLHLMSWSCSVPRGGQPPVTLADLPVALSDALLAANTAALDAGDGFTAADLAQADRLIALAVELAGDLVASAQGAVTVLLQGHAGGPADLDMIGVQITGHPPQTGHHPAAPVTPIKKPKKAAS